MKTKSADFNALTDASSVKKTIQEAFQRVLFDGCTSKVRMDLTLAVVHGGGEKDGNVLVSRTLSGSELSENHVVRAYQDLAREMPDLIDRLSAGTFLMQLHLEKVSG
ncbi:MAG: hypothetical protein K2X93_25025 [Candidatus Obscuribacterales bacterium]|nr:hypothetical protein [Candidatus Obscuribacterales bacterium]